MSAEKMSFDFISIIPETYRSKAQAFARTLHDKLASLGSVTAFYDNTRNYAGGVDVSPEDGPLGGCQCTEKSNVEKEKVLQEEEKTLSKHETASWDILLNCECRPSRESSRTRHYNDLFPHTPHSTGTFFKSEYMLTEILEDSFAAENGSEEAVGEECLPHPRAQESVVGVTVTDLETDSEVRLRRCSSLKTGKTPPGTPGEKKIVRFADALGLDLADIRTFLDEIPRIPSSAYESLRFTDISPVAPSIPTLLPKFNQPAQEIDFPERVMYRCVALESAVLTDSAVLTISGNIRVRNIAYEKAVRVRYTIDNWNSFSDLQATHASSSQDGLSDTFSFVLYGHTLRIGETLEFAIWLDCNGLHYWDNNEGKNYAFECLPQSPSTGQLTDPVLLPGAIDTSSSAFL